MVSLLFDIFLHPGFLGNKVVRPVETKKARESRVYGSTCLTINFFGSDPGMIRKTMESAGFEEGMTALHLGEGYGTRMHIIGRPVLLRDGESVDDMAISADTNIFCHEAGNAASLRCIESAMALPQDSRVWREARSSLVLGQSAGDDQACLNELTACMSQSQIEVLGAKAVLQEGARDVDIQEQVLGAVDVAWREHKIPYYRLTCDLHQVSNSVPSVFSMQYAVRSQNFVMSAYDDIYSSIESYLEGEQEKLSRAKGGDEDKVALKTLYEEHIEISRQFQEAMISSPNDKEGLVALLRVVDSLSAANRQQFERRGNQTLWFFSCGHTAGKGLLGFIEDRLEGINIANEANVQQGHCA